MVYQTGLSGYQLSDDENEEQQSGINPLVSALGLSSAAAGGGFLIDTERRRRQGGPQGFKDAAQESVDDLKRALGVIRGRSEFDKTKDIYEESKKIVNSPTADHASKQRAQDFLKDNPVSPRSIRDFASNKQTAGSNYFTPSRPEQVTPGEYVKNPLTQIAVAARDAFQPSPEDFLSLERDYRTENGRTAEGPRSSVAFTRMPLVDAYRDLGSGAQLPGSYDSKQMAHREQHGLDLMKQNLAQKIGSTAGRSASDLVINNGIRSFWWLVNAPQAISDLVSEGTAGATNEYGLYGQDLFNYDEARERNLIDADGVPLNNSINYISDDTKSPYLQEKIIEKREKASDKLRELGLKEDHFNNKKHFNVYGKRRTGNNLSTLLALPAAYGINAGLGLVNPLGGGDGYKAVLPSEDDPTKTSNVMGEIASKYILGRRGDILPWSEFKKVRPDVTKDEYMQYKAYKWDKGLDLNPFDDGDFNLFGGLIKGTDNGINGGEIQFLGKHMETDTVLTPSIAAALGAAAGAAYGKHGGMTYSGLAEGVGRAESRASMIKNKAEKENRDLTNEEQKVLSALKSRNTRAENRVNISDNILSTIPGLRTPANRQKRLYGRSPVLTGLVGGFSALAGSSLIGHELERRRREEKVQQKNSFDYNALNIS